MHACMHDYVHEGTHEYMHASMHPYIITHLHIYYVDTCVYVSMHAYFDMYTRIVSKYCSLPVMVNAQEVMVVDRDLKPILIF